MIRKYNGAPLLLAGCLGSRAPNSYAEALTRSVAVTGDGIP